jgi:electron transport complex protein RnfC
VLTGKFASEVGVVCQNVATTKAISDALIDNQPLISRIVTITGNGVARVNFEVRLGAPFSDIVTLKNPKNTHTLRVGGLMMGTNIFDLNLPICKTSTALIVNKKKPKPMQSACIRCNVCNTVCPIGLLPQQLFWFAKSENTAKAITHNLLDCIECASCDYVCPSHIPLTQYFSFAKGLYKQECAQQNAADIARERFEYREFRLARNQQERTEMMAQKKKALKEKMANEQAQKDKIADAMQRIQEKKNAKH